jgi:predicted metal-dependent hydrolase
MTLTVYHDARCVVTIPRRFDPAHIEPFVLKKAGWISDQIRYFQANQHLFIERDTKKEYAEYKNQAYGLVIERLGYFNAFYGLRFAKVAIKNQKTRWGSCSKKGNLNFNYRIAKLSPELVDYLIVHELCHLKEMNHGRKFWSLVAQTIPNWRILRRELKKKDLRFF